MHIQRPWYLYILRCSHTFLYTGISPDVTKRLAAHRTGKGAKFTKNKSPLELVYLEVLNNMQEAMKREREIKKYAKSKKESLVASFQQDIPSDFQHILDASKD